MTKQTNQLQHLGERTYNCVIFYGEASISNLRLLGNIKPQWRKVTHNLPGREIHLPTADYQERSRDSGPERDAIWKLLCDRPDVFTAN